MPNSLWRRSAGRAGVQPDRFVGMTVAEVGGDVVRLIEAVASVLPGQTRRGATAMSDARLARPFTVFAGRGGR